MIPILHFLLLIVITNNSFLLSVLSSKELDESLSFAPIRRVEVKPSPQTNPEYEYHSNETEDCDLLENLDNH